MWTRILRRAQYNARKRKVFGFRGGKAHPLSTMSWSGRRTDCPKYGRLSLTRTARRFFPFSCALYFLLIYLCAFSSPEKWDRADVITARLVVYNGLAAIFLFAIFSFYNVFISQRYPKLGKLKRHEWVIYFKEESDFWKTRSPSSSWNTSAIPIRSKM